VLKPLAPGCHFGDADLDRVQQRELLLFRRDVPQIRDDRGTFDAQILNAHRRRLHLHGALRVGCARFDLRVTVDRRHGSSPLVPDEIVTGRAQGKRGTR